MYITVFFTYFRLRFIWRLFAISREQISEPTFHLFCSVAIIRFTVIARWRWIAFWWRRSNSAIRHTKSRWTVLCTWWVYLFSPPIQPYTPSLQCHLSLYCVSAFFLNIIQCHNFHTKLVCLELQKNREEIVSYNWSNSLGHLPREFIHKMSSFRVDRFTRSKTCIHSRTNTEKHCIASCWLQST